MIKTSPHGVELFGRLPGRLRKVILNPLDRHELKYRLAKKPLPSRAEPIVRLGVHFEFIDIKKHRLIRLTLIDHLDNSLCVDVATYVIDIQEH